MPRHHQFYMQWTRHTSLHYIKSYTMCQLFCRHQLPCVLLLKCDCHILPFNCPHLERGAGLQFWDNLYSQYKKNKIYYRDPSAVLLDL